MRCYETPSIHTYDEAEFMSDEVLAATLCSDLE